MSADTTGASAHGNVPSGDTVPSRAGGLRDWHDWHDWHGWYGWYQNALASPLDEGEGAFGEVGHFGL